MSSSSLALRAAAVAAALFLVSQAQASSGRTAPAGSPKVAGNLPSVTALARATGTATAAPAATSYVSFDVSGIYSNEFFGDALNEVYYLNVGANSSVVSVAWEVDLYADAPSWLQELAVSFTDSSISSGVTLTPGAGDDFDGFGSYAGSISLDSFDPSLVFNVGPDGILRLEFHEVTWNDWPADWDGVWEAGTLTFGVSAVPEVSTYAMMALGLVAVGGFARRRKA